MAHEWFRELIYMCFTTAAPHGWTLTPLVWNSMSGERIWTHQSDALCRFLHYFIASVLYKAFCCIDMSCCRVISCHAMKDGQTARWPGRWSVLTLTVMVTPHFTSPAVWLKKRPRDYPSIKGLWTAWQLSVWMNESTPGYSGTFKKASYNISTFG